MQKLMFTLLLCWSLPAFATKNTAHPLDPLSAKEVNKTLEILRKNDKFNGNTLLPYLILKEPAKAEVLNFQPGRPFKREALAEIYDKKSGKLFENHR